MEHPNKISIRFPKDYVIDEAKLQQLCAENAHLYFKKGRGNSLQVEGKDFIFEENRIFSIASNHFSENLYEQASKLNKSKYFGIQYADNQIFIEMGTFGLISALTAIIIGGLVYWNQQKKSGRVYTEEGEYKLPDAANKENHIRVKPDVSYIDFNKADEQKQDKWLHSYIDEAPTLAIEIVSSKNSLKITKEKMLNIWMKNGTLVGLVIDPFRKKIFICELRNQKPREQSILKPFTHPLLPGYSGDFSTYADKF